MNHSLARMLSLLGLTVLLLTVGGCLGSRDWHYPPESSGAYIGAKAAKPIPARVVVLPFEDLRGNTVKDEYWKAAIPFILFGELEYDRPEEVKDPEEVDEVKFDPPKDFAKATTKELQESGVFSSVEYAGDGKAPPSDLVVHGTIRSTNWERRLYTYLLGPLGTVFWVVGVPMGQHTTTVELDLRLTPASNPSVAVWEMSMEFKGKKWDSPYYNLEEAVQTYPFALQEALRPAILDLVALAEEDPDRLYAPK